ncbi:DNA repair protein Rad7, protein [Talaromyces proteolyticus]|uniref:DNA repair protein Rad7, protein n=1 Tax=Talaromyces proteolyticus TaxID=1131652 RepID=A0AAD4KS83_9EURO|nr:DNA repair protein Rad7, protein [Talaromyces proteolyticus]KAH8698267.1 DNA repair protein Rad7, protein [Talaromyces proteolyticus]
MSRRRQTGNQIRGPHSALTDFLASNNISAAQIRDDYEQRLREPERRAERETGENGLEEEEYDDQPSESPEQRKKRKRKEAATLAKIKQSKEFARRKASRAGDPDDDDDEIAREMMYQKSRPLPGQLENCEICSKRFTVTPYSKAGPNGGLLCTKCSKEIANEEKKARPKKAMPKVGRRQHQSKLLDGLAQHGASSLVEMCTKKVADNINDIEEFGDLPSQLLHRLSQILSKRRVMTPRTLQLFLRADLDSINIYDCGKLETDDFEKIFAFMPSLVNVNLRFAGQMKDRVVDYMVQREFRIKQLQLDAANLISDTCWRQLFTTIGPQLEALRLSNLDCSLDDETVEIMSSKCANLRRLKLTQCDRLGNKGLVAISNLPKIEHLSLDTDSPVKPDIVINLVQRLGSSLHTLSLKKFHDLDDEFLHAVHTHCRRLAKLRFSGNAICTDKGYVSLFAGWSNPPLKFVDLSSTRDVDNAKPDGPEDPIGLASEGFMALMQHSGSKLERLNISSCRHISLRAFESVFDCNQVYPNLQEMDISFDPVVDDFLVSSIFKCCPSIKKLTAFGCVKIHDVKVPVGVALIGGLRAQDSIIIEGE